MRQKKKCLRIAGFIGRVAARVKGIRVILVRGTTQTDSRNWIVDVTIHHAATRSSADRKMVTVSTAGGRSKMMVEKGGVGTDEER